MRKRIFVLAALAVYLELVFHLYMGLDMRYAPVFLCAAAAWGLLATAVVLLFAQEGPAGCGSRHHASDDSGLYGGVHL